MQEQRLVFLPRQVFRAAVPCLGAVAALALIGCGNNYRPVVSGINPVGPSSQPTVYATALADPGNGNNGQVTVVNVFGETIAATALVAPQPIYATSDSSGQTYVTHRNNVLVESLVAQLGLQTNLVRQSSLTTGVCTSATLLCQVTTNGPNGPVFITEPAVSKVAVFKAGTPPTILQELPVPANPVYTIANPVAVRAYTLSQGDTPGTSTGTATAIESGPTTSNGNNAISASIPVGIRPVYGVMSLDARRAFVLNGDGSGSGTGTVTVINTVNNAIDAFDPTDPLKQNPIPVGVNPVWADIAPNINEMAVLNQGAPGSAGSLTVVNIALCSPIALPGNQTCDPTNPADSADFGHVLGTVPVGVGAVQVAVLPDLNKAYIANAGDGTVTVVDLKTLVATVTIHVGGHLNWIQAVPGSPTGKVLVTASDTQVLTMIRTDNDTVTSTIPLQGFGVAVRIAQ